MNDSAAGLRKFIANFSIIFMEIKKAFSKTRFKAFLVDSELCCIPRVADLDRGLHLAARTGEE